MPTADDLRALARSSPWLWTTARFTLAVRRGGPVQPVRAWLRRPDALRVETVDGRLLQAGFQQPPMVLRVVFPAYDGTAVAPVAPSAGPGFRPDGLVADRAAVHRHDTDAPFYRDYHWVAVLDPVELADGDEARGSGEGVVTGTEITDVREVVHAGRSAWSAVVRPTAAYEPRCACCSLLRCAVADRLEGQPLGRYADAHLVVLDRGTGICVATRELGGPRDGEGHELELEAVDGAMDGAMDDALFR